MNIVHLIFSFNTGGAETMLVDILNRQSLHNETHLIVINDEVNEDLLAVIDSRTKIHRINRKPCSRNPLPILYLNYLLRKIDPDVVHMHNVNAIKMIFIKYFCSWFNVVTVHSLNKPCNGLKLYDKIFAISEAVKNDIIHRSGLNPEVIPNGVDFNKIRTNSSKTNICFKIVQISRLFYPQKGQHLLMEAISKIETKTNIKIEVTFIGEGESLTFLQSLANRLVLKSSCKFSGLWSRKKIYQELCEFDLLVQPSIYEGFGLTVIEGIGAKIPVLASTGGGPEEILGHGRYGWLFENGDTDSLAEGLAFFLDPKNAAMVRKKTENAYDYAVKKYSIDNTADTYIEKYGEVTG